MGCSKEEVPVGGRRGRAGHLAVADEDEGGALRALLEDELSRLERGGLEGVEHPLALDDREGAEEGRGAQRVLEHVVVEHRLQRAEQLLEVLLLERHARDRAQGGARGRARLV